MLEICQNSAEHSADLAIEQRSLGEGEYNSIVIA